MSDQFALMLGYFRLVIFNIPDEVNMGAFDKNGQQATDFFLRDTCEVI